MLLHLEYLSALPCNQPTTQPVRQVAISQQNLSRSETIVNYINNLNFLHGNNVVCIRHFFVYIIE